MIPVTINGEETIEVSSFLIQRCQEALMDPELARVIIVAMICVSVLAAPFIWKKGLGE